MLHNRHFVLLCILLAAVLGACSDSDPETDTSEPDMTEETDSAQDLDIVPDSDTEDILDAGPDLVDSDAPDGSGPDGGDCPEANGECACLPPNMSENPDEPACGELVDFGNFPDVRIREECAAAYPGTEEVALGVGDSALLIPEGDERLTAEFVRGPQGGYHIFGGIQFEGLEEIEGRQARVAFWITHCSACGDGYTDGAIEDCEPGEIGCSATCEDTCGNEVLNTDSGEVCDTGGVSATCDRDCTPAECGDGRRNSAAGELCEPDGFVDPFCMPSCVNRVPGTTSGCGDGFVYQAPSVCNDPPASLDSDCQRFEECDDGNFDTNDRCVLCKRTSCGDGILQSAVETCDDGSSNGEPGSCNLSCDGIVPQACGDGTPGTGEDCDGAGEDTATCDSDCTDVECGDGYVNAVAGEVCDDAELNGEPTHCNATCTGLTEPVCGNGVIEEGENCEDSVAFQRCDENGENCVTNINLPACDDDCFVPICGDGVVSEGETCDSAVGNTASCDGDCTDVECGDGFTNPAAGEACDDGGENGAPGKCNATCSGLTQAVCGNGVLECGEACDDDTENCSDTCEPTDCVETTVAEVLTSWIDLSDQGDGPGFRGAEVIFTSVDETELTCISGTLHALIQLDDCRYYHESIRIRPVRR